MRSAGKTSRMWLLALAVGVIAVYGAAIQEPGIYLRFAIGLNDDKWFSDTLAVLVCSDLYALGGDPLSPNSVAMHFYSTWWFGLDALGLSGADAAWLGLAMGTGWAIVSIWWIRPETWWAALLAWLVMVSPAFFLGFNRGNVDLLLVVLLAPVPWLLTTERAGWRWVAPVILALGTGLKYYPLLAWPGLLWARGARRRVLWLAGAGAALIVAVLCDVLPDYLGLSGRMLSPGGFLSFGGVSALAELGLKAWALPWAAYGLFFSASAVWVWRSPAIERVGTDRETAGFVLGACLLLGCFVLAGNYIYRMVFAVFMLPWLFAAVKGEPVRLTRGFAAVTLALLVVFLWGDGLFGYYIMSAHQRGDADTMVRVMAICRQTMAVVSWLLVFALQGWLVALGRARLRELVQSGRRS